MKSYPKSRLVKPTFSVLFNPKYKHLLGAALKELRAFVGEFDLKSPLYHQEHLENYYGKEMGTPLLRLYLSAKGLMDADPCSPRLNPVMLKHICMHLEEKYTPLRGRRVVNIDPGFVDQNHLFLTTHKERGGRTYLGKGVYLEMEYLYFGGEFKELFWTYRDYRLKEVKTFFERVREKYLRSLRELQNTPQGAQNLLHPEG